MKDKIAYMIFTNKIMEEAGTDNTKKYIRMVMGVYIIFNIISPFLLAFAIAYVIYPLVKKLIDNSDKED